MLYEPSARDGFETPSSVSALPVPEHVDGIGLREIWATIYRSRFPIIAIMTATILAAIIYTLVATQYYRSTVTIEVRQEAEKVLGTEADRENGAARSDTEKFLQTQLDIIRSRGVANAVAQARGYYRGNTFLQRMRVSRSSDDVAGLQSVDLHRERVIDVLKKYLSVQYSGNTRIAELSFQSPDAVLSAEVANAYADAFVRTNLTRKFNSSAYALDFLRGQLREAQDQLQRSERAALDYGRQTRIVDVSNAAGGSGTSGEQARPQSLVTAQLVQLNQTYSTAIAERISAEQRWRRVADLPLLDIPEVLASPAVQQLLSQRAQVGGTYRQELSVRQESYPTVRRAAAQLADINNQLTAIASDIRRSIKAPYDIALAREQQVGHEIDQLKNSTLTEQSQGIELSILRREADTNRQQYDSLLRRYNELNAEAGVQTNNLNVIDRADVPRATAWPKPLLNLAIAIAVGLVLSTALVIAREQLFDAVRTPTDITDRLGLPLLGTTPKVDDPQGSIELPKSDLSEAFASIRTSLVLTSDQGLPKTLLVTSAQAQEGKSSTTKALAISLGRLGHRILVVDVDFRRPNVHKMFGGSNKAGLSNALAGQAITDQIVQTSTFENVSFITTGVMPPNPAEMLSSKAMAAFTSSFLERFDCLIFDSAPLLGLADAVVLASEMEATVFVVEAGRNSVRGLQAALTRLRGDARIVGAILTKFDPGQFGYGRGDAYGYNYSYAYGGSTSA